MSATIRLRGVEVHNLKKVSLDIPRRRLVVCCGVSGSGKTSLALDTLYAEGQRRYIETFSTYTRQFLERIDKPAAESIDGIPPSIAVTSRGPAHSNRATAGTASEIVPYLRLLFAKIGTVVCPKCGQPIQRNSPGTVASQFAQLPSEVRFMIGFPAAPDEDESFAAHRLRLVEDGFIRAVYGGKTIALDQAADENLAHHASFDVIIDRLAGGADENRIRESLEQAFRHGHGNCCAFLMTADASFNERSFNHWGRPSVAQIDSHTAWRVSIASGLCCQDCHIEAPAPDPRLFSFNSPLGACPACQGTGKLLDIDMDLVVSDKSKSIKDGAISPWNTPAYRHELQELLTLAPDYGIPLSIPFDQLEPIHWNLIKCGVPARKFGGLDGFFERLEKQKSTVTNRAFLGQWRSSRSCSRCQGTRLRSAALATLVGGKNIDQISSMKVGLARRFFDELDVSPRQRSIGKTMLDQIQSRLSFLDQVGLDYLTLDRPMKTLSTGESQRVALTTALGSSLVNMMYVLDEPSVGLHPRDTDRLLKSVESLRDRGNSVIVVEHDESFLRSADHIIEIGPSAGEQGGTIVFQGSAAEMLSAKASLTGEYLSGKRAMFVPERRRASSNGWIKLIGARGNNLRTITAEFPLGVLCAVTGVSGSGKSTLIEDTLYPALCQRKRKAAEPALPYDDVIGDGQIDDVVFVDQSPIGKSARSNPVTYIKAFDAIRNVFAETIEARTHNYSASHFSFNVDGGRCAACQGDGCLRIDMQFMADVFQKCGHCQGRRFRKEILEVTHRGKSIADVLEMSVRQAFGFFRGREKVQFGLKRLMDVGLDYLRLGQPANSLSAGEAQRLKLASYLSTAKRKRTLFLLDEPTAGLHFSDVVKLLDCFDALLNVGHSLIVIEHNVRLMKAADYMVDLGPGSADEGGAVVACGTPEDVERNPDSVTGRFLKVAALCE